MITRYAAVSNSAALSPPHYASSSHELATYQLKDDISFVIQTVIELSYLPKTHCSVWDILCALYQAIYNSTYHVNGYYSFHSVAL